MKQKMKYLLFICLSLVLCSVQHVLADDGTALEVPRIREGQEMQGVTVSPNWRDALEPGAIYEADASRWFEGEGTLTYRWLQEEAIGDLRLDAATGALEFRPWSGRPGRAGCGMEIFSSALEKTGRKQKAAPCEDPHTSSQNAACKESL